jgi:hypothetical protein
VTEGGNREGVDGETTPVESPLAHSVTVTLSGFEVRVLQIILQHLVAGQSIDPSTLDYTAMVHLQKTLNLGLPRRSD